MPHSHRYIDYSSASALNSKPDEQTIIQIEQIISFLVPNNEHYAVELLMNCISANSAKLIITSYPLYFAMWK